MPNSITLQPAIRIRGLAVLPGDKSLSHRALILAACTDGRCRIENLGTGDDIRSTIRALRVLGVRITLAPDGESAIVEGRSGRLDPPDSPIECGNSATTMRLLAGILAAQPFESILTGDESLNRRSMGLTADAVRKMGADVQTDRDDRPPLTIRGGQLTGIPFRPHTASAQVKSATLLAGLFAVGTTVVHEPLPTRDHTERLLGSLGGRDLVEVDRVSRTISVYGEQLPLKPFDLVIPGDTSSAAYPITLATLLPESTVTVPFVGLNPGRIAFFRHLQAMGAKVVITPDAGAAQATGGEPVGDLAVHTSKLRNVPIAPERIPAMIDELPLLAAVACQADRSWEIRGAERLRSKETDRIATITAVLNAMGAEVEEYEDGLGGPGGQKFKGGTVDCASDHRIAMTAAVAAWCADSPTTLIGADSVRISFPTFFPKMAELVEQE